MDKDKTIRDYEEEFNDLINSRVEKAVIIAVEKSFEKYHKEMKTIVSLGFPEGDLESHRKIHELHIKYLANRNKLLTSVYEKTLTAIVWGGILFLGNALLEALKKTLNFTL